MIFDILTNNSYARACRQSFNERFEIKTAVSSKIALKLCKNSSLEIAISTKQKSVLSESYWSDRGRCEVKEKSFLIQSLTLHSI